MSASPPNSSSNVSDKDSSALAAAKEKEKVSSDMPSQTETLTPNSSHATSSSSTGNGSISIPNSPKPPPSQSASNLSTSNPSTSLNLPPPPPLPPPISSKSLKHVSSPSDRNNRSTEPSPLPSPSSISISSKTTVKTGIGLHVQRNPGLAKPETSQQLQHSKQTHNFELSLESGNNNSNTHQNPGRGISYIGRTGPVSVSSPKMSPTSSNFANKVTTDTPKGSPTRPKQATSLRQQPVSPQRQSSQSQKPSFANLDHPPLALPRKASRCPLFCCFYAEFDNVVGPKICFESPLNFMEQSTDVSLQKIHKSLSENFDRILAEQGSHINSTNDSGNDKSSSELHPGDHPKITSKHSDPFKAPLSPMSNTSGATSQQHPSIKGARSGDSASGTIRADNTTGANSEVIAKNNNIQSDITNDVAQSARDISPLMEESKGTDGNSSAAAGGGGSLTSIFDSTCDFIITGNELTGNIVNLSAYNMHLLTRPTIIHNKRYERNSLLFCVGFVLRRTEDPRPFRPLLSKLALALKRMEMESHFLSNSSSRQQLQPLLDRILVSLNSTSWETNLVVQNNVLNLKLFHPPKYPASPVPDHAVPILLRRDLAIQIYDWDLAINWVVLHIDGVANARQISKKAEVDMEMVRNCLRVLKHHGVISIVDMFFYSNRYESTKRAASQLSGSESSLLQEAAEYVIKRPNNSSSNRTTPTPPLYSNLMMSLSPPTHSPTLQERFVHPPITSVSPSNSPLLASSYPPELADPTAAAVSSGLLGSSFKYAALASYQSQDHFFGSLRREEQKELKAALAELYGAFNRNINFGDLWVALAAGPTRKQSIDRSVEQGRSTVPNASGDGTEDSRETSARFPFQQGRQQSIAGNAIRSSSRTYSMDGSDGTLQEQSDVNIEVSPKEFQFERLREKRSSSAIDWSSIFEMFDHRRFVSFGLVNGLLQRVHDYPVVLGSSSSSKADNFSYSVGNYRVVEEATRTAIQAAAMMDGLHCDDYIASRMQKPLTELVDLVEKYEGRKVLSTYAIATDS